MDWSVVKHMLFLKGTWAVLLTNIGIILVTIGIFDNVMLDKYKIVVNCILVMIEALGFYNIYKTEPKEPNKK